MREVFGDSPRELFAVMAKIFRDPKTPVRERREIAAWVVERGWGKTPDMLLTLDGTEAAALLDLEDSDLLTFAREFLGKRAAKVIDAKPVPSLPQSVPEPVNSDQTPVKLPNSPGDPE